MKLSQRASSTIADFMDGKGNQEAVLPHRQTVQCRVIFVKNVRSRRTEVDVQARFIVRRKIMRTDLRKDDDASEGSRREGRDSRREIRGNWKYILAIFFILRCHTAA